MNLRKTFLLLLCAFSILIPSTSHAQSSADLLKQIAALQAQIAAYQAKTATQAKTVTPNSTSASEWSYVRPYNTIVVSEKSEDSVEILEDWDQLTVFAIKNGQLKNPDLNAKKIEDSKSNKTWQLFKSIAGENFIKKYMDEYMTYDLSDEASLAFVERFERTDAPWYIYKDANNLSNGSISYKEHRVVWGLAINLADSNLNDSNWTRDHVVTLLHEYAHILTLNDAQIDYSRATIGNQCKNMSVQMIMVDGVKLCTKKNTYLDGYLAKFWSSKQYTANGSNFVTKYAATSPEEDIAESFTNFVLQTKPTTVDDVGDEKILFFYNYPDLVTMRTTIRANIGKYFK